MGIVLCTYTWGPLFWELQNNWSVHNVETLREQRTISVLTLHVTLNVIRRTQPKHSRRTCFSTEIMSKLTHFKPRQAMMLPRSKIHSIYNDKVSRFH